MRIADKLPIIPANQDIRIPSALFNWLIIKNKLPFPVEIQASHDEIGNPAVEISEAKAADKAIEKRLQEIEGVGSG